MQLMGKVIVITGASDGIGKQIALRLAKEGTKLALIGRDIDRLAAVGQTARDNGSPMVQTYACDLRQTPELEQVVDKILSDF